jgi:hypothetical protein
VIWRTLVITSDELSSPEKLRCALAKWTMLLAGIAWVAAPAFFIFLCKERRSSLY